MKKMNITADTIKKLLKQKRFSFIKELFAVFPQSEVYLVGGAVRDLMLCKETKDYDFVIRNISINRLQKFLAIHGKVNLVGKKFGVFKFNPLSDKSAEHIDIALPRTEFSIGHTGHYRDFTVQSDPYLPVEEDLSRRDFTINALAWDVRKNVCVDLFGGQDDLRKKIIRTVGNPKKRFEEDYSRMLRAVRFACSLGFTIEEETMKGIMRYAKKLNDEISADAHLTKNADRNTLRVVPYEVIAKEMVKAFVAAPVRAMDIYDELKLFRVLIPELNTMRGCPHDPRWHSEGDVWAHTRLALSRLQSAMFKKEFPNTVRSAQIIFATLFHDIGKPATIQIPGKDPVDRIRYIGHDRVGADIARRIAERLRLASVEGYGVDVDTLYWLIKNHLLILNTNIDLIRNNTLEKYFFVDRERGQLLQQLFFLDGSASLKKNLRPGLETYRRFKKKLADFDRRNAHGRSLPPALLDGDDIMRICTLHAGARVGELKLMLREEQLSGRIKNKKEAREWLKKI